MIENFYISNIIYTYKTIRYYPVLSGDIKDSIVIRIIQALPQSLIFLYFTESNQDTVYHELNSRRLGLILSPDLTSMKFVLKPP